MFCVEFRQLSPSFLFLPRCRWYPWCSSMKDTASDCKMACTSKGQAFKEAELCATVGNSFHKSFWCLLTSLKSYYNTFFLDKDIFWTPSCTKKKISNPDTERTSHIACSSGKCVELRPQGVWSGTWRGYKRLIPAHNLANETCAQGFAKQDCRFILGLGVVWQWVSGTFDQEKEMTNAHRAMLSTLSSPWSMPKKPLR